MSSDILIGDGADLLTRGEVALRLRTSERTVARLAAAGSLTEVRVAPGVPRITAASLQDYLERIGAVSPPGDGMAQMAAGITELVLTDDDRNWLSRCTIGGLPILEWLAGGPPPDRVRAYLVKWLDRGGTETVFARVLAAHLGADPITLYAENWPRKAAKLAEAARARGDHPHADKLHAALVALMFCANCGRPLNDPVSVDRGIGPDCWERIDPSWRAAIEARTE